MCDSMSEQLKLIAEKIIRIRISQMMVNEQYKDGKFQIPIHLAFGHETIAVAINEIMDENDKLILTHRNIAYNLARLGHLKPIMDEYFLQSSGLDYGKSGSMNLINPNKGIIYTSSILGNNFSVAVGIAYSEKIKQNESITIVLGGDGSIEEGSFHESLLMLKTYELPSLVIIENNEWSMSTKINQRRENINLEKLCGAFEIDYFKLKGNNVFEYIENFKKLRKKSIQSKSPICIEVMVKTLGEWELINSDNPNGKIVNYHAGGTPSIDICDDINPIVNNSDDPLFVLEELFSKEKLNKIKNEIIFKHKVI